MLCLWTSLPFIFRSALKALLSVTPETRRTRDLLQGCAFQSQVNPITTETKAQRERNRLVEIRENPAGRAQQCGSLDLACELSRRGEGGGGRGADADQRQHQGQFLACSPAAAADGARRAAARTPQQASARAPSPPARAPRPGLGWSRACRSQRGSWVSRAVAAARSWQRVSPGHALASSGASRSLLALTLPARPQQAPPASAWAAFAATRCAPDRGTPAPSRVSKSSASRGSVVPMVQGKGQAGAQVTV